MQALGQGSVAHASGQSYRTPPHRPTTLQAPARSLPVRHAAVVVLQGVVVAEGKPSCLQPAAGLQWRHGGVREGRHWGGWRSSQSQGAGRALTPRTSPGPSRAPSKQQGSTINSSRPEANPPHSHPPLSRCATQVQHHDHPPTHPPTHRLNCLPLGSRQGDKVQIVAPPRGVPGNQRLPVDAIGLWVVELPERGEVLQSKQGAGHEGEGRGYSA